MLALVRPGLTTVRRFRAAEPRRSGSERQPPRQRIVAPHTGEWARRGTGKHAAAPEPHAVHCRLAGGLPRLVDGVRMEQHLDLVEPAVPGERVGPFRQQRVDVASGRGAQRRGRDLGQPVDGNVPASRVGRKEPQAVRCEVSVERADQGVGGLRLERKWRASTSKTASRSARRCTGSARSQ